MVSCVDGPASHSSNLIPCPLVSASCTKKGNARVAPPMKRINGSRFPQFYLYNSTPTFFLFPAITRSSHPSHGNYLSLSPFGPWTLHYSRSKRSSPGENWPTSTIWKPYHSQPVLCCRLPTQLEYTVSCFCPTSLPRYTRKSSL